MVNQKIRKYRHHLIFLFVTSWCFAENKNEEEIAAHLKNIDSVINKISDDHVIDKMIAQEKIKIIQNYIKESQEEKNIPKNDKDAHFFTPKYPMPLTEEEKKINIYDRIAKKYIGKIPLQMNNVIFYYTHQELCIKQNRGIHNRLLLHGVPGTGKSYLFKVVAQELQIPTLSFSASFFADKYIGESSRRIRRAFDEAKKLNKPVLIFIDEIDALATKRKDSTHDEHRATLITLLTELQDLQDNKNIFVIAATNDYLALDPAIRDRFAGSVCEIKQPTVEERGQLFEKIFKDKGVNINKMFAKRLAEVIDTKIGEFAIFSNRDVEYIVTTALLLSLADCTTNPQNCDRHWCHYFKEAIDSTGKQAVYANWTPSRFCDGI